jgi:hypothetical protein
MGHVLAIVLPLATAIPEASGAAAEPPRIRKTTVIGTVYEVDPRFEKAIEAQIARARKELEAQRSQGKLIAYLSTPISSRGGGDEATNLAISDFVKVSLEGRYGVRVLWVMDPGKFQLPRVEGQEASGSDYLYMWTEILAGPDGTGKDFDMVYFTGPTDMWAFFGSERNLLEILDGYIDKQAQRDDRFRQEIAANRERRQAFLRFYALRASGAYSKGVHDEWNLFVKINRKRGVGEQIALYFDGRALSPAEMETEILPGYEKR